MTDEIRPALARLIEVTAYNHYLATLVGNPAPRVKALYERMTAPQAGDLVLEVSTIHDPNRVGTRLGRLARVASEPIFTPERWSEGGGRPGEPIPRERVWYIHLPDGREFRWVNADFIAVPTEIATHDQPWVSDPSSICPAVHSPPED